MVLKVRARSAISPSPSTSSTRTEKSPPPNFWAASLMRWRGSVRLRIRNMVSTLAQISIRQADSRKLEPNRPTNASSIWPEAQTKR